MKTELSNLLLATSKLRLRIQERAPAIKAFSEWESSAAAMREAQAALTRATAPAPASGWMELARKEVDSALSYLPQEFVVQHDDPFAAMALTFAKLAHAVRTPAPDVAKLEAEVAELKANENELSKELCQLQDALGCPCEIDDAQEKAMERIRDLIAAEGEVGDAKAKASALETENARLRAALQNLVTVYRVGPDGHAPHQMAKYTRAVDAAVDAGAQALAASPAPSAWREMEYFAIIGNATGKVIGWCTSVGANDALKEDPCWLFTITKEQFDAMDDEKINAMLLEPPAREEGNLFVSNEVKVTPPEN